MLKFNYDLRPSLSTCDHNCQAIPETDQSCDSQESIERIPLYICDLTMLQMLTVSQVQAYRLEQCIVNLVVIGLISDTEKRPVRQSGARGHDHVPWLLHRLRQPSGLPCRDGFHLFGSMPGETPVAGVAICGSP
jgi:hypothetical protein